MGSYAKVVVPLSNTYYDVEVNVDLEVTLDGEFDTSFEFDILDWEEWEDEERRYRRNDKSEVIGEYLYDVIDLSETLRAEVRRQAIDNYDGAED